MDKFLQEQSFLYDRVKNGIDVHPSDAEVDEFVKRAKAIQPELDWAVKGCQECVNNVVKFVYDNQTKTVKKESFPKAVKPEEAE